MVVMYRLDSRELISLEADGSMIEELGVLAVMSDVEL
jgi:hypothetical protein